MRVQGVRIGPAEHLMLQQRVLDVVEEFAKTRQQVGLGDDQVNRKAHIQRTLNEVQLLGQPAGFFGDLVRRILDETFDG